jgi:hypothetical protein
MNNLYLSSWQNKIINYSTKGYVRQKNLCNRKAGLEDLFITSLFFIRGDKNAKAD